jgi:hypothetical protein
MWVPKAEPVDLADEPRSGTPRPSAPDETRQEESMTTVRMLAAATAFLLVAGPAAAVTVKNTSNAEISIGVDYGSKSDVKNVPAGKSVTFDCPDGCGVTGPWGFSWMAKGDDVIPTDGKSLVTVQ